MKNTIILFISIAATSAVHALTPHVGASAGYFLDAKTDFLTARLGATFNESGRVTHAVEIEFGHMERTVDETFDTTEKAMPMMLNYRLSFSLAERFSLYTGIGFGRTKVVAHSNFWVPAHLYGSVVGWVRERDEDNAFSGQALLGGDVRLTDKFSVVGGARFLWVDSTEFFGSHEEPLEDVVLEAGACYRF